MDKSYQDALKEVDQTSDSQGKPVDAGIKTLVAALWANGIGTSGSCEGHQDHGFPYPWVDIEAPAPAGWEQNEALQKQWWENNLQEYQKTAALLDEYYSKIPSTLHLVLIEMGIYGSHRLQPASAQGTDYAHIAEARKQTDGFANFLIERLK